MCDFVKEGKAIRVDVIDIEAAEKRPTLTTWVQLSSMRGMPQRDSFVSPHYAEEVLEHVKV